MDQFVPICSTEVNSSPVSPGYWPSQQEPPANPYTEREWERGREEGGLSGNERERQAISEKWASAEKKTRSAAKERWRERSRWRREMRKLKELDGRGSWTGRRGKKEVDGEVQVLADLSSAPPSWSWKNGADPIVMPQSLPANWHQIKGSDTRASFRGNNRGQYCLCLERDWQTWHNWCG